MRSVLPYNAKVRQPFLLRGRIVQRGEVVRLTNAELEERLQLGSVESYGDVVREHAPSDEI
jgi:hypothetical protein